MTRIGRLCRWCGEPVHLVEPVESCGWAHDYLPEPDILRYWCGTDDTGEMRRVEPA